MAKIKTKDGDVFMVRGYFQTRRNPERSQYQRRPIFRPRLAKSGCRAPGTA